jgi:hypothetical protein
VSIRSFQLALRADRIERLQQHRPHQPLGWDRPAADRRIQFAKLARERFERRIGNIANQPQRMIRPDPLVEVYITEKTATNPIVAAHCYPPSPTPRDHNAQF